MGRLLDFPGVRDVLLGLGIWCAAVDYESSLPSGGFSMGFWGLIWPPRLEVVLMKNDCFGEVAAAAYIAPPHGADTACLPRD